MADVTVSVTFKDGSIIRAVPGFIDIENWESMDNKLTLAVTPRNNRWEVFAGAMPDTAGTLKGISIAGVPYRVLGDTNVTLPAAEYKNEPVATSGQNNRRMTKQARTLSGVIISCNVTEMETLRAIAEG
jgi:hypothetical protein